MAIEVEDAAHQLRRHRHAADPASENCGHRSQKYRRPIDCEARISEAEIVDPRDFRIEPQDLTQRQHNTDCFNAEDQRVQARIGQERDLDLLVEHEGNQPNEDDEHEHPDQEDARRR